MNLVEAHFLKKRMGLLNSCISIKNSTFLTTSSIMILKKSLRHLVSSEECTTFALANGKQQHRKQENGAIAQLVRAHDS